MALTFHGVQVHTFQVEIFQRHEFLSMFSAGVLGQVDMKDENTMNRIETMKDKNLASSTVDVTCFPFPHIMQVYMGGVIRNGPY